MADMIRINWKESVPAVIVQFIAPWSLYNAGETAGFAAEVAQSLVDAGRAVYPIPLSVPTFDVEQDQTPVPLAMTKEEELTALGVDTSTKEDSEEEMKRKALRRPPKDKMVKGSQTK